MIPRTRLITTFVSLLVCSSSYATNDHYHFNVYLDDESFGTHSLQIERNGTQTTIITQAEFEYTLLFIPLYTYQHRTTETWLNDCLITIDSSTDDNGEEFFVKGMSKPDLFTVSTREGEDVLDSCVRTFAYWDVTLLDTPRLLNTQNGLYQSAELVANGTQELVFKETRLEAVSYTLRSEEGDIGLWYSESGRWLALESVVENGSTVRYISRELGADS